jgi:hypothetical protein
LKSVFFKSKIQNLKTKIQKQNKKQQQQQKTSLMSMGICIYVGWCLVVVGWGGCRGGVCNGLAIARIRVIVLPSGSGRRPAVKAWRSFALALPLPMPLPLPQPLLGCGCGRAGGQVGWRPEAAPLERGY